MNAAVADTGVTVGEMNLSLPDYPAIFWVAAILAMFLAGISKAGLGNGLVVLVTPLVAMTIPITEAIALLLPLLVIMDILTIYQYRRSFDKKNVLLLIPAGLVGVLCGSIFIGFFNNERVMQLAVGVIALAFVVYQLSQRLIFGALVKRAPKPAAGLFFGALGGFTSTLAHAGGPPLTIYLLPQKLPRRIYIGTAAFYFFVVNVTKLIPYTYYGMFNPKNFLAIIILIPFAFIGVRMGLLLVNRINDKVFNIVIYILLTLTGIQLILGLNLVTLIHGWITGS